MNIGLHQNLTIIHTQSKEAMDAIFADTQARQSLVIRLSDTEAAAETGKTTGLITRLKKLGIVPHVTVGSF